MSTFAKELARASADNITRMLNNYSEELPSDANKRLAEYVARAAVFRNGLEYAAEVLRMIAAEGDTNVSA